MAVEVAIMMLVEPVVQAVVVDVQACKALAAQEPQIKVLQVVPESPRMVLSAEAVVVLEKPVEPTEMVKAAMVSQ